MPIKPCPTDSEENVSDIFADYDCLVSAVTKQHPFSLEIKGRARTWWQNARSSKQTIAKHVSHALGLLPSASKPHS